MCVIIIIIIIIIIILFFLLDLFTIKLIYYLVVSGAIDTDLQPA